MKLVRFRNMKSHGYIKFLSKLELDAKCTAMELSRSSSDTVSWVGIYGEVDISTKKLP